ncbi:MAG: HupE/UreJ family protein [Gammaproteobacteria bacterium]
MTRLLITALAFFAAALAHAHAPNQSYVFIDVYDDAIEGRVEITLKDLNTGLGLDMPTDGSATLEQIADQLPIVRRYVQQNVALGINGEPLSLPLTDYDLHELPLGQYLALNFSYPGLASPPETIDMRYTAMLREMPDHRGFLIVEDNWKTGTFGNEAVISLTFTPTTTEQSFDLSDNSTLRGFIAMVKMGTHHIWIGIDHILFLLALLIPAVVVRKNGVWQPVDNFRDAMIHVLKIVTVFTIAHTITLSLAALGKINLSSRVVESIIALSIAVAALDILIPIFKRKIWWIVFGFGLFHGFGFASILGGIGIPPKYMVHSLLGFNLGVELGQVVVVCLLFPVLYLLRNSGLYIKGIMRAGAIALIIISMYWFIERAFEVDLPAGAIVNRILGIEK